MICQTRRYYGGRRRRVRRTRRLFLVLLSAALLLLLITVLMRWLAAPPALAVIEPVGLSAQSEADAVGASDAGQDWQLILVNAQHALPDDFSVELADVGSGHSVDARIASALQVMLDDCRAAGLEPLICSSYRTQQIQQSLFDDKVQRLIAEGYAPDAAQAKAGTVVAAPGTSEHQTGLAVDLVDAGNQNLDETQEQTPVQQWLIAHSWEYGFVLRYPNDKSSVTGIIYEPWHYRYVGKDAARDMHEGGLCLEEYLQADGALAA